MPNDFNDQVLALGDTELLRVVERRVLGEIKNRLQTYYSGNGYYPYPAALNYTTCDSSRSQGHVPAIISGSCPALADWATALPGWFSTDGWNLLVWYAVAPACSQATPNCSGPGGFVDVRNTAGTTNDKQAIVVAAGPLRSGQNRTPTAGALSDLLDSAENSDDSNLVFEKLPVDTNSNDQILIVAP